MNFRAIAAIYTTEMMRTGRTLAQSIVSPVLSTALYFVVFGAAIGSRISEIEGVNYGSFIVPGLIMLTLLTQSTMNASFGIYFPRFAGTTGMTEVPVKRDADVTDVTPIHSIRRQIRAGWRATPPLPPPARTPDHGKHRPSEASAPRRR